RDALPTSRVDRRLHRSRMVAAVAARRRHARRCSAARRRGRRRGARAAQGTPRPPRRAADRPSRDPVGAEGRADRRPARDGEWDRHGAGRDPAGVAGARGRRGAGADLVSTLPVARARAPWWRRVLAWLDLPPLPFVPLVLKGFPISAGPSALRRGYQHVLAVERNDT